MGRGARYGAPTMAARGRPANGAWPKNWTHQRTVKLSGRLVKRGMTTSDIVIHTNGPYTAAAFNGPYVDASRRRTQLARVASTRNTADHVKATVTCIASPAMKKPFPPWS